MVFKKIAEFIDREHVKILITIVILLIALVVFMEYSTFNDKSLGRAFFDFLKSVFS